MDLVLDIPQLTVQEILFQKFHGKVYHKEKIKIKDFIPVARITDMREILIMYLVTTGKNYFYPEIKLIYWAGGNLFHHHQDLNRLVKAWQIPDTIIVNEIWWNSQARHADSFTNQYCFGKK